MQQCPECNRMYDESESALCPYCYYDDGLDHENVIVYDKKEKKAKVVPISEAHLYD